MTDVMLSQDWIGLILASLIAALGFVLWRGRDAVRRGRRPIGWTACAVWGLAGLVAIGSSIHLALLAFSPVSARPIGRLVDVGGYRMHIVCAGHSGPATIILPGWQTPSVAWLDIMRLLASRRRTCIVDRPGYAWSDAGPFPRSVDRELDETRIVLARAGEHGPYILIAHSLSGPIARLYAARHPSEVAGLVLLDTSTEPTLYRYAAQGRIGTLVGGQRQTALLDAVGVTDLFNRWFDPVASVHRGILVPYRTAIYSTYRPRFNAALASEMEEIPAAADALQIERFRGDLPLVVIAANGGAHRSATGAALREREIETAMHLDEQRALARLSSRSAYRQLDDSDHMIGWDRPDAIKTAVDAVAAQTNGR